MRFTVLITLASAALVVGAPVSQPAIFLLESVGNVGDYDEQLPRPDPRAGLGVDVHQPLPGVEGVVPAVIDGPVAVFIGDDDVCLAC